MLDELKLMKVSLCRPACTVLLRSGKMNESIFREKSNDDNARSQLLALSTRNLQRSVSAILALHKGPRPFQDHLRESEDGKRAGPWMASGPSGCLGDVCASAGWSGVPPIARLRRAAILLARHRVLTWDYVLLVRGCRGSSAGIRSTLFPGRTRNGGGVCLPCIRAGRRRGRTGRDGCPCRPVTCRVDQEDLAESAGTAGFRGAAGPGSCGWRFSSQIIPARVSPSGLCAGHQWHEVATNIPSIPTFCLGHPIGQLRTVTDGCLLRRHYDCHQNPCFPHASRTAPSPAQRLANTFPRQDGTVQKGMSGLPSTITSLPC